MIDEETKNQIVKWLKEKVDNCNRAIRITTDLELIGIYGKELEKYEKLLNLIESQNQMIDFILEKICFVGAEDIFSEICLKCSKGPKRISECAKHIKMEIRKKVIMKG